MTLQVTTIGAQKATLRNPGAKGFMQRETIEYAKSRIPLPASRVPLLKPQLIFRKGFSSVELWKCGSFHEFDGEIRSREVRVESRYKLRPASHLGYDWQLFLLVSFEVILGSPS